MMPIINFMRTIKIDNDELAAILTERGLVFRESVEVNKKIVELDEERTKLGHKMIRLKDKTAPIINELSPTFNLNEWEIITGVHLNAEKYPEVEIVDQLEDFIRPKTEEEIEEFKKMLKEKETLMEKNDKPKK